MCCAIASAKMGCRNKVKVNSYSHLPLHDQISFIRLLIFIEGLTCIKNFEKAVNIILKEKS